MVRKRARGYYRGDSGDRATKKSSGAPQGPGRNSDLKAPAVWVGTEIPLEGGLAKTYRGSKISQDRRVGHVKSLSAPAHRMGARPQRPSPNPLRARLVLLRQSEIWSKDESVNRNVRASKFLVLHNNTTGTTTF